MIQVREGVLGCILTPGEPTVEEQARYMREWLVIETVDAGRVVPGAASGGRATFFCKRGISRQHGLALVHLYFQCRS